MRSIGPAVTREQSPGSFATRMEDWTSLGQHKRHPEFPVVTRESRCNSRKSTWYINAHGTSTHHNDLFETRAIRRAFGDAADQVIVNSTKSMIGHLLGAAGGVEFVTCVKELEEGFIHQTVGTKETDEECDLNYAIGAPIQKDFRYAMTNSLGFGGHNATLLIRKYEG